MYLALIETLFFGGMILVVLVGIGRRLRITEPCYPTDDGITERYGDCLDPRDEDKRRDLPPSRNGSSGR
jgi:hypothetical protein